MVAEVGLIRIALEACFVSFDRSIAGNYIEGLIKTHQFHRLLVPKMIRGIFDVP